MLWIFKPKVIDEEFSPDYCSNYSCEIQYGCTTNFSSCPHFDPSNCIDLYFNDPCMTLGDEPCPTFETCYPVY